MKTLIEATKVDGVKVCKHEIEVVCAHCQDPVSAQEEATGTCTNSSRNIGFMAKLTTIEGPPGHME